MTTTLAMHGVQLHDYHVFTTSPHIIMLIAGFAALLIGSLGMYKCLSCDESSHQSRHIGQVFFASMALVVISLFILAFSFFNFPNKTNKDYDNNVAAFTSYGITESDADGSAFSFKHNVYYSTSGWPDRAIGGLESLSAEPQPGTYTYTRDDPVTGETYHMKITIDNSRILRVFMQKKQAHNNWVQLSPHQ